MEKENSLKQQFLNGEVAIVYAELDHFEIEKFLRNTFPNDVATFSGVCKYYIANYSKKTWQGADRVSSRTKLVKVCEIINEK